jgi:putative ABC transport system substrate-binding protein
VEPAFATFAKEGVEALFIQVGPFTTDQRTNALAAQHFLATIYALREFVDAGGLMSCGTSIADANRQLGIYASGVLKATKAAVFPVVQSTTFELVINMRAAKALGLAIPQTLLARVDEVIE